LQVLRDHQLCKETYSLMSPTAHLEDLQHNTGKTFPNKGYYRQLKGVTVSTRHFQGCRDLHLTTLKPNLIVYVM